MKSIYLLFTLVSISVGLTGCGRNSITQSALPIQQNAYANTASGATNYLYPTAKIQTPTNPQAMNGGRAVATPTGYVYEQNPLANSNGYAYYNSQNPCLYPKPGQQVNCSGASAYAGTTSSGTGYNQNPNVPSSYAGAYTATNTQAYTSGVSTQPYGSTYGTTTPSTYGTNYGAVPTTANPYGTVNTNPYGTATNNPYGAPAANTNPYATTAPAANYGTNTGYTAPTGTVQASSATKAVSRIDTSSSSSNTKKGPSF